MTKSNDLHKLISDIQDQHMTPVEESRSPYLGLFYVVNGKLYWDGVPLNHVQGSIQYKIYPKMHPTFWKDTVVKDDVTLKAFDAYHFPRGRIVYDGRTKKYELVADQCILSDKAMTNRIISEFHLQRVNLVSSWDSHYKCVDCT